MAITGEKATARLDLGAALWEMPPAEGLIASRIFPIKPVKEKSGAFSKITRESFSKLEDVNRAPDGKYNRVTIATAKDDYACVDRGLEGPLDDDDRKNAQNDYDAELGVLSALENKIALAREKRVADKIFNTTTFTGAAYYKDYSGSAPWTTAGSPIKEHVEFGRDKFAANCARQPNAMIVSLTTARRMKQLDDVVESIKYVAKVTDKELSDALSEYLDLEVLIGGGMYDSANENQTFTGSFVWSNLYAMLALIEPKTGGQMYDPMIGKSFLWTEDSPQNPVVEEYYEKDKRATVYRLRSQLDEKLLDVNFGFLLDIAES